MLFSDGLLGHCGLILAWKVELVCASWSPLKKTNKQTTKTKSERRGGAKWIMDPSTKVLASEEKAIIILLKWWSSLLNTLAHKFVYFDIHTMLTHSPWRREKETITIFDNLQFLRMLRSEHTGCLQLMNIRLNAKATAKMPNWADLKTLSSIFRAWVISPLTRRSRKIAGSKSFFMLCGCT